MQHFLYVEECEAGQKVVCTCFGRLGEPVTTGFRVVVAMDELAMVRKTIPGSTVYRCRTWITKRNTSIRS